MCKEKLYRSLKYVATDINVIRFMRNTFSTTKARIQTRTQNK